MTNTVKRANIQVRIKELPSEMIGTLSDWYHTFNELYDHRIALYSALVRTWVYPAHKSKTHHDWSVRDWRFICTMYIDWKQISYHAPDKYRDKFNCEEREKADERDWHTSNDVLKRLWLLN